MDSRRPDLRGQVGGAAMKRGDLILVAALAIVGLVAAGWIYDAGYRDGEEHGRTAERIKRELERQLEESVRQMDRGGL